MFNNSNLNESHISKMSQVYAIILNPENHVIFNFWQTNFKNRTCYEMEKFQIFRELLQQKISISEVDLNLVIFFQKNIIN